MTGFELMLPLSISAKLPPKNFKLRRYQRVIAKLRFAQ
jgi:hypothetical protein